MAYCMSTCYRLTLLIGIYLVPDWRTEAKVQPMRLIEAVVLGFDPPVSVDVVLFLSVDVAVLVLCAGFAA